MHFLRSEPTLEALPEDLTLEPEQTGAHGRMTPATISLVGHALAQRHRVTRCRCGGPEIHAKKAKASWCPACGRREELPAYWHRLDVDVRLRAANGRATLDDVTAVVAARKASGAKRVSFRKCATCGEHRMAGLSMRVRHCRNCSTLSPRERRWKREAVERERT